MLLITHETIDEYNKINVEVQQKHGVGLEYLIMAHKQQMEFFESVFDAFKNFIESPNFLGVVDLGSHDTSGGPHTLLPVGTRYVGVDLCAGDNVNVISPIELVDLPSASFSIAISSEVLEHNPFWRETLFQLCRLSSPGGLVVWTCAGLGSREHGTSRSDGGITAPFVIQLGREYYKNIAAYDAEFSFDHSLWFSSCKYFENFESRDTYFVGLRIGKSEIDTAAFESLINGLTPKYVTNRTLRSYLHSLPSENYLAWYFKILQVKNRIKRFLVEKGKIKKIARRFKG